MKDADKMTPDELRALAEAKESGEWKVVKTGKLKHDLFNVDFTKVSREVLLADEEEKDALLEKICSLAIAAGAELECYLEHGKEYWVDEDGWVEGADSKWAKENLIGIKEVK